GELRKIGNCVNVGCYFKMSPESTHVRDVENSRQSQVALNPKIGTESRGYLVVDGDDHGVLRAGKVGDVSTARRESIAAGGETGNISQIHVCVVDDRRLSRKVPDYSGVLAQGIENT